MIDKEVVLCVFGAINLMISTSSPEPEVNFWEELVIKVQEIENRNG